MLFRSAKGDSGNDRKSQLRKELDDIRNQQSETKFNRGKVLGELKALQDGIQKKVPHSSGMCVQILMGACDRSRTSMLPRARPSSSLLKRLTLISGKPRVLSPFDRPSTLSLATKRS